MKFKFQLPRTTYKFKFNGYNWPLSRLSYMHAIAYSRINGALSCTQGEDAVAVENISSLPSLPDSRRKIFLFIRMYNEITSRGFWKSFLVKFDCLDEAHYSHKQNIPREVMTFLSIIYQFKITGVYFGSFLKVEFSGKWFGFYQICSGEFECLGMKSS